MTGRGGKQRWGHVFATRVLVIALLILLGVLVATPTRTLAAEAIIGPAVGKVVSEAQGLAKAVNFSAARKKIDEARRIPDKSAYEIFVIEDYETYLNVKLKDYPAAARSAEAALATGMVPRSDRPERLKTLAKLNFSIRNYIKTIAFTQKYASEAGADDEVRRLEIQAYYLQKDYAAAQKVARATAIGAKQDHSKPDEAVLQIWNSAAYHEKDRKGQHDALTALVNAYPKPAYLKDLVRLVADDLGRSDRMSFEIFRVRLAAGLLETAVDYVEMAQLAIQLGLPGEALEVMIKGRAAGVLGGANKSRELRLQTVAGEQARRDEALLESQGENAAANATLGEAYASYGKREEAIALYKAALATSFSEADLTRLHLGQVYFSRGDSARANVAFSSIKTAKLVWLAQLWMLLVRGTR